LKMAYFHFSGRVFTLKNLFFLEHLLLGHRYVSFSPIKNQLYIGQKVKALPLPFCQFF
jgi:hypothetical protein